jgi:hypothetical protein
VGGGANSDSADRLLQNATWLMIKKRSSQNFSSALEIHLFTPLFIKKVDLALGMGCVDLHGMLLIECFRSKYIWLDLRSWMSTQEQPMLPTTVGPWYSLLFTDSCVNFMAKITCYFGTPHKLLQCMYSGIGNTTSSPIDLILYE